MDFKWLWYVIVGPSLVKNVQFGCVVNGGTSTCVKSVVCGKFVYLSVLL